MKRITCRAVAHFNKNVKELIILQKKKCIYKGLTKDAPEELRKKNDLKWLIVYEN